jgi:hypothetical protein
MNAAGASPANAMNKKQIVAADKRRFSLIKYRENWYIPETFSLHG